MEVEMARIVYYTPLELLLNVCLVFTYRRGIVRTPYTPHPHPTVITEQYDTSRDHRGAHE